MKETERIASLFSDLYDGQPWIDVNITGILNKITAEQAVKKISPRWNSVWEITNHLIYWRMHVLERLQGVVKESPADNYFRAVSDASAAAWAATLKDLEDSQIKWNAFLEKTDEGDLENQHTAFSNYKLLHGILQHDAYHLGQIAMLANKY